MRKILIIGSIVVVVLLLTAAGLRFALVPTTSPTINATIDVHVLKAEPELEIADTISFGSISIGVPFTGEITERENGIITRHDDGSFVWLTKQQTGRFVSDMKNGGISDELITETCRFLSRNVNFDACSDDYLVYKGIIEAQNIDASELSNDEERRALEVLHNIHEVALLGEYSFFEKGDVKGFISYGLSELADAIIFTKNDEMYSVMIRPNEEGYVDFILSNTSYLEQ